MKRNIKVGLIAGAAVVGITATVVTTAILTRPKLKTTYINAKSSKNESELKKITVDDAKVVKSAFLLQSIFGVDNLSIYKDVSNVSWDASNLKLAFRSDSKSQKYKFIFNLEPQRANNANDGAVSNKKAIPKPVAIILPDSEIATKTIDNEIKSKTTTKTDGGAGVESLLNSIGALDVVHSITENNRDSWEFKVPFKFDTKSDAGTKLFENNINIKMRVVGTNLDDVVVAVHGGPGDGMNSLMRSFDKISDQMVIYYDQILAGESTEWKEIDPNTFMYNDKNILNILKNNGMRSRPVIRPENEISLLNKIKNDFSRNSKITLIGHSWGSMR